MMKHEFEQLVGFEVSQESFDKIINRMYMVTDMDKHTFCQMIDFRKFKIPSMAEIIREIIKTAKTINKHCTHFYDAENEERMRDLLMELQKRTNRTWYYEYESFQGCFKYSKLKSEAHEIVELGD